MKYELEEENKSKIIEVQEEMENKKIELKK